MNSRLARANQLEIGERKTVKDVSSLQRRSLGITEYTSIKGDANYDGVINIVDVVTAVNILLGTQIPIPEQACSADCNGPYGLCDGDGVVDILDALKIVNLILELDECP